MAKQAAAEPRGIPVSEVAELTGFDAETIYRAYHRGELAGMRLGKRILILRTAVDKLLAGGGGGQNRAGAGALAPGGE